MIQKAGMDSVGMSTSHEAIVACYCGIKVLAFSIITDMVPLDFDAEEESDHSEIVKVANEKVKEAEKLVARVLEKLTQTPHSNLLI
jgi:purine-nucleoside phosphorylase